MQYIFDFLYGFNGELQVDITFDRLLLPMTIIDTDF